MSEQLVKQESVLTDFSNSDLGKDSDLDTVKQNSEIEKSIHMQGVEDP